MVVLEATVKLPIAERLPPKKFTVPLAPVYTLIPPVPTLSKPEFKL